MIFFPFMFTWLEPDCLQQFTSVAKECFRFWVSHGFPNFDHQRTDWNNLIVNVLPIDHVIWKAEPHHIISMRQLILTRTLWKIFLVTGDVWDGLTYSVLVLQICEILLIYHRPWNRQWHEFNLIQHGWIQGMCGAIIPELGKICKISIRILIVFTLNYTVSLSWNFLFHSYLNFDPSNRIFGTIPDRRNSVQNC